MPGQIASATLERFSTFGDLLKFLRRRTGLTQRELAQAVGYSHAQISRLELNQRLPDLATVGARFVEALDLEREPRASARLLELAETMRREDAPASGQAPYKGLRCFDEADADLFFGREAHTERVLARVQSALAAPGGRRFLAIVGASGSGKSSLARAGLIPAIRWSPAFAGWLIASLTPTARPLDALAASLAQAGEGVAAAAALAGDLGREPRALHRWARRLALAGSGQGRGLLLVVDQFEELFTLCRAEAERQAFVANLLHAAGAPDAVVFVALTLRADFYAHCAPYPELREALAAQQEYLGPMTAGELRRAIAEPAQRGGWTLEPGLVDVVLKDLGADSARGPEPGALPLLSHALLETWQRRRGRTLTVSGYLAAGGVRGAIAETAEVVYHDELDAEQQAAARGIFLRLTELGEAGELADTRRRASLDELVPRSEAATLVRAVLTRLADARLIITAEGTAEVAHEALIREWPTLRGWLEENRDGLRLHRHLTLAAEGWARQGRDPGELYRGARLAQAAEWAAAHDADLNALEREFLQAAQALAQQEAADRDAQRQRELDAARALAETRGQAAAQLRRRALFLAAALLVALATTAAALYFGNQARQSAQLALANSRLAATRELAAAALSSLDVDPERGILLALRAVANTRAATGQALPEAEEALHRALLASHVRLTLRGHEYQVLTGAYSPDGRRAATIGQDGNVIMWDASSGQPLRTLPGITVPSDGVGFQRLAYSADGALLAAGDADLVRLYDADTGAELHSLAGHDGEVWSVAFSPNGQLLASGATDGVVRVWEAATGALRHTLTGATDGVGSLAFSPDSAWLAAGSDDGSLRVWETAEGALVLERTDFTAVVGGLAFSPECASPPEAPVAEALQGADGCGQRLAVGAEALYVLAMPSGEPELEITLVAGVTAFSPDGRRLAAVTGSVAKLWDARTGQEQMTLAGHAGWVTSLAFSPDGRRLLTASFDRTARIWDVTADAEALTLERTRGVAVAFSPECVSPPVAPVAEALPGAERCGARLVVAGADGTASVWNAATGEQELLLTGHEANLMSLALSADGARLVTGSGDWTARLWDLATGESLTTFAGHSLHVRDVALSPDGARVATASFDGTARVWDVESGQELLRLAGHAGLVVGVAFSPEGQRLATAGTDGVVVVWDVETGAELLRFAAHEQAIPDIAYSPDGTRLVTVSNDSTGKVWDAATGAELFSLNGHRANIWSVAYSPDGTRIATGSADNTALVWDAATGELLQRFAGSQGEVTGVAFSPDSARLAVISSDGVVRVYLLRLDDLLALAQTRVTRALSDDECRQFLHVDACPTEAPVSGQGEN